MQIFEAERRIEVSDQFRPPLRPRFIIDGPKPITVPNLMPYTDYRLSMTQIANSSRRWSEPTIIDFKTDEAGESNMQKYIS